MELATSYFKKIGPDTWFVIGSGAPFGGGIRMNPKLKRLLDGLKAAGIEVKEKGWASPGSCDSVVFTADFEGGSLEVHTGNYIGYRGGTVTGAKALTHLVELLGLRLTNRTAKAWGLNV